MKILIAHNFYQLPGGEDVVFAREKALLEERGHEVFDYVRDNREIEGARWRDLATLPARAVWNWQSYSELRHLLNRVNPDVAHFHNTFPLISPAAYQACRDANVPVVQSLHNSRLICPAGVMSYKKAFCQDCLGKRFPWPGVLRACYRGSAVQTATVGMMSSVHRALNTWNDMVARYVVFTRFYYRKFCEAGFPSERLVIKPHFVEDPGVRKGRGRYAIYLGRLSEDKGVLTLLNAWKKTSGVPLKMFGVGPLEPVVRDFVKNSGGMVEVFPFIPREEVMDALQDAAFLVWPSEFSETFGLVAIEAFAKGVPVIASNTGCMPEIVADGRTGLTFRVGDADDLADKISRAWEHPDERAALGVAARSEYETKYTPERNYAQLIQIYREAISERSIPAAEPTLVPSGGRMSL
jgi:glycosyltransferase involved in cell wall biosynthesis